MGRRHGKHDMKARALFAVDENGELLQQLSEFPSMTAVQAEFFDQFKEKINIIDNGLNAENKDLCERFRALWEQSCFGSADVEQLLHSNFLSIFGEEGAVDGKSLAVMHTMAGVEARKTNFVRVNITAFSIVDSTAVIFYEYLWDYFNADGSGRKSEIGQVCEHWVKADGAWYLLADTGGALN